MLADVADRHNFGQHVKPMERASSLYFQKPRTVFWEWLFFGVDSPLARYFSSVGENSGFSLAPAIFGLEVDRESEWAGTAKAVLASDAPVTPAHFASFGTLLAYAYIFGIRDLHSGNLIRCVDRLQVIDAEVVLARLVLPHETLLLPFKDTPWSQCGLSLLAANPAELSAESKRLIIAGFIDALAVFHRAGTTISRVLRAGDLSAPVRLVLRNTREYAGILAGRIESGLLEEERAQLARGDIPYFFKRVGGPELFWMPAVEPNGAKQVAVVQDHTRHAVDVDRHALSPEQLLEPASEVEKRLVHGLLFLRKHLQLAESAEFIWRERSLVLSPEALRVDALAQTFVAPARRE